MNNFEQHELGFPGSRRANLRLRRGIYLLPSLLTVANMVCGFYAVMSTLKGELADLDTAAKAIGFAIVFDSFDGFVARATGTSSEFGKQFDSLADMVSFGIAPAHSGNGSGRRLAVLRGFAVPGGRRTARGLRSRDHNSHRGLALVDCVDGPHSGRGGADGEHGAIQKLQGHPLGTAAAVRTDRSDRCARAADLLFFPSHARADRHVLCGHRSRAAYRACPPPSLGFASRLSYESHP